MTLSKEELKTIVDAATATYPGICDEGTMLEYEFTFPPPLAAKIGKDTALVKVPYYEPGVGEDQKLEEAKARLVELLAQGSPTDWQS